MITFLKSSGCYTFYEQFKIGQKFLSFNVESGQKLD